MLARMRGKWTARSHISDANGVTDTKRLVAAGPWIGAAGCGLIREQSYFRPGETHVLACSVLQVLSHRIGSRIHCQGTEPRRFRPMSLAPLSVRREQVINGHRPVVALARVTWLRTMDCRRGSLFIGEIAHGEPDLPGLGGGCGGVVVWLHLRDGRCRRGFGSAN